MLETGERAQIRCGLRLVDCKSLCKALSIPECTACEITEQRILDRFDVLSDPDLLEDVGLERFANAIRLEEQPVLQHFTCPEFGHNVVATCGLTSCGYHAPGAPEEGNCLVQFLQARGQTLSTADLTIEDVARLDGVTESAVRKAQRTALRRLAANQVLQAVHDGDLPNNLFYLPDLPVCVVCESRVDAGSGGTEVTMSNDKCYYYCSDACMVRHPVFALEAEVFFGTDFKSLLLWVVQRFNSLGAAERALNLTRAQIYEAASLFLTTSLDDFFPALRGLKERRSSALVKRTWHYPRLFHERAEKLRQGVLVRAEARHGISQVDVNDILVGVESLIGPDKAKQTSSKRARRTP